MVRDTFEHETNDLLGMKVQLDRAASPDELKRIGERLAIDNRSRKAQVWVWLYGADMDLDGPAACVSYVGEGTPQPVTQFIDPAAITVWYLMRDGSGETH